MGTPAFPDLGKHCAVPECSLVDFLPFTCDGCEQVFCLEHRSYGSHKCTKGNKEDVTVLVCPMCAKAVRLIPNEDPNVTWDRHVRSNCDPSNYTKATQKPRCPVQGCKELLTFSNKVRCKDCGREVCLKHRFGADHKCQELRKADAAKKTSYFTNQFNRFFRDQGSGEGARSGVQAASSKEKLSKPVPSKSATAAGNSSKPPTVRTATPGNASRPSAAAAARTPVPREFCPECGMRFHTVVELIQHAESSHSARGGQWRVGSSQDQLDVCPKCGKGFSDAVALVTHVEKDHGGTSSGTSERCSVS
ncbi:hypothetical protein R1flu_020048 [Riccia fluitans]|uniref:Zinc finger AN1 and C2H2 domain-containing stress-associated protein 16 n=1 Tax=Riccia fluitans TaxID=41844 RepID=A0ABD1ZLU8_9MARC